MSDTLKKQQEFAAGGIGGHADTDNVALKRTVALFLCRAGDLIDTLNYYFKDRRADGSR